jgi:hypothetical protein
MEYLFYDMRLDLDLNIIISDIEIYKPEKIIFFAAYEYELGGYIQNDLLNLIDEYLIRYNIIFYIIFGSGNSIENFYKKNKTNLPKNNTEIILWPMFWLFYTNSFKHSYNNINKDNNINKLFISLNNRSHYHRCQLIDEIFHNGLNDYGNLSWIIKNNEYDFKYWKQEQLILDEKFSLDGDYYFIPNEYKTSLINLISESTTRLPFLTEKTFMSILYDQPFIIYGSSGIHQLLVEHGFELYDEIFDYSFDSYDNGSDRIDSIINNLLKIKDLDYNYIRNMLEPKIMRNKKHALNIIKNNLYVPELVLDIFYKYSEILNEKGILNFLNI